MTGVDQKQRQAESGKAQERIDASADIQSFHFIDSWLMAIEFEGRIENELLTIIEDSRRTVGLRSKDGKYKAQTIEPIEQPDGSVQHPYGEPDAHAVTISTGPNYQSQREQANEFADTLAKVPEFAIPLGPLIIELKQLGPVGDKMKKVLTAILPPAVAQAYDDGENGQQPLPPQAVQALQQSAQAVKALNAHAQQIEAENAALKQKLDAQVVQSESKERISTFEGVVKLAVAELSAKSKMQADAIDAFMERTNQTLQLVLQGQQHAHEVGMASMQGAQAQEAQQSDQQHAASMQDQQAQQAQAMQEQQTQP